MEDKKIYQTGIWQGRFHYIHNGYYYVFLHELQKFDNKMIAIVNPNPLIPPTNNFDGFKKQRNPFNYFQRMQMWKRIIDNQNWDVMIFPCWHGIFKVALENDFLPAVSNRCWIVPLSQHEAELDKANALKAQGEHIYAADFEKEDPEYASLNPAIISQYINKRDETYKKFLPECIWDLTEELFTKQDDPNKYYLIPVIGDKFDMASLQYALDAVKKESNRYILFAINVHVSTGEKEWSGIEHLPWWFKQAKHPDHGLKYYKKADAITKIMKALSEKKFFITPLFVYENDFDVLSEYNMAFLPNVNNIYMLFNETYKIGEFYKYNICGWADNIGLDDKEIIIDNSINVSTNVFELCTSSYSAYVSQPESDKRSKVDILFDDIKKRITDTVDEKICSLKAQIRMGGLNVEEKERINDCIKNKYPELRMKYYEELKTIMDGIKYPLIDEEYENLKKRLETKLKDLERELEK